MQGGIIFWLCGNLQDVSDISHEIASIKNYNNDKFVQKNVYFLKLTRNYPYKYEFALIDRNLK